MAQLEEELQESVQEKLKLLEENERLQLENSQLKDDSDIAAQQLKKFTEWFFHAIEKKDE